MHFFIDVNNKMKILKITLILLFIALFGSIFLGYDFLSVKRTPEKFDLSRHLYYADAAYFENIPVIRKKISEILQQKKDTNLFDGEKIVFQNDSLLKKIYQNREFSPVFGNAALAETMLSVLENVRFDGLNPSFYRLNCLKNAAKKQQEDASFDANNRAFFDILLTDAALSYASHLASGKCNPQKILPAWNFIPRKLPTGGERVLQRYSPDSLRISFEKLSPDNLSYKELKKRLRFYLSLQAWDTLPEMNRFRLKDSSEMILKLKKRLLAEGYFLGDVHKIADTALISALKNFQKEHILEKTGCPDQKTIQALNIPLQEKIKLLRANMERLRWTGHFSAERISVNIAAFQLYLYHADTLTWTTRVIIGKPYASTPAFTAKMTDIVFNPTWTVPTSIIRREILHELRRDAAGYLQNNNMEITNLKGEKVNVESINWAKNGKSFPYLLRQRAGSGNSLGTIKFNLPNPNDVYLHDTPNKKLFSRRERAYSHGCVRVENPYMLAEKILCDTAHFSVEKISELIQKGKTKTVKLSNPVSVYILYQTAGTEPNGDFIFRKDLYGRDTEIVNALDATAN